MTCAICGIRKAKRHCPGVNGEICAICCGTGREQTVDCPLGCEFLRTAHEHERVPEPDPETIPNRDIDVSEEFLRRWEALLILLGVAVVSGSPKGATDYDVRAALDALTHKYKAIRSGLFYEPGVTSPYAVGIRDALDERIADLRRRETEARGETSLDDETALTMLVFLQQLEYSRNNGRRLSRAFLDFLSQFNMAPEELPEPGDFLDPDDDTGPQEPDAPMVIL